MAYVSSRSYPDLLTWRRAMGWSQTRAAAHLGVTQTHYSRLERQVLFARGPRAKHIMVLTGVPVEVLVGAA